jgi:hypothetical protein
MCYRNINSWSGSTPSGRGIRVSVFWCGGEVDTIFGFEKDADALQWIKEKSQGWSGGLKAGHQYRCWILSVLRQNE